MFEFFGPPKIKLNCCFCARSLQVRRSVDKCPYCNGIIPDRCKDFPTAVPFFVPMIGWSNVGKTVWLLAVIRRLRELSATVWNNFTPIGAYESTLVRFRECEEFIRTRRVPKSTRAEEVIDPQVTVLHGMPRWGDRTFIMRDCPGEFFKSFTIHDTQVQFLRQTQIAFCMISLADLWAPEEKAKSMEEILQGYINTLGKDSDLRQQRRKFVVVFSKCDEMLGKLPPHLYNYLMNDPVTQLAAVRERREFGEVQMAKYMEELARVSDEIQAWVETYPDGKMFLNLGKAFNMDFRFTIVSSLGCPARNSTLEGDWTPYRVLDPLFWALEFHSI